MGLDSLRITRGMAVTDYDTFKAEILAEMQGHYTEEQKVLLFEVATQFSSFAFKKWGEEK